MADEMTYFSPFMNSILDGKSAVYAAIAPIEGQIQVPKYEISNPKLQLGGNIAVFTYQLLEFDEAGAQTAGWKISEISRLVDDKWRIIHAHYSAMAES
jgi:hypothetical protein